MTKQKKHIIGKSIENFIRNNFDKKDRKKEDSLNFEWFVNSMYIWQCSSQTFNANSKIGKDISLSKTQGGDSFFISINDYEQIFFIGIDEAIEHSEAIENFKLIE